MNASSHRKLALEQENFKITQAVSSVNSAVASGFATADDVTTMTSLSGDPVAQKQYADKILAKTASRTQYPEALAATRAAANLPLLLKLPLMYRGAAAAKAVTAQTALDVIDVVKNNPLPVLKAVAGSTNSDKLHYLLRLNQLPKDLLVVQQLELPQVLRLQVLVQYLVVR